MMVNMDNTDSSGLLADVLFTSRFQSPGRWDADARRSRVPLHVALSAGPCRSLVRFYGIATEHRGGTWKLITAVCTSTCSIR